MKEEKKYSGSKTRNYFTAYLLASIQGRRLRYLEKQQKILFAEENLEDKEITDIDISLEERLELEKKEQLLLDESKGIYPEWNEMTDINLMEAMFSLQEEERKLIYQHVFEERTFKEMSILNQMPEERCKNRKYCDGSGTHDKIIDNIAQFHEYENRTKMRMQATHVVTRNNYEDLYNSVKYLVEDLEMQVIDSALDLSVEWNYEQLDFIAKEWEKVIEYNLMRIHKGKPFMWGLIIDMQQYFAPSVCKGCGVGAIRIYVRTDGSIYGCASNLTETGYLGDVKGGLIIQKVKHYLGNEQECLKCNHCIFKRKCLAKICLMNRTRQENGNEIPNWVMCYLEEKKQTLWNKYKEYIRILV